MIYLFSILKLSHPDPSVKEDQALLSTLSNSKNLGFVFWA